MRQILAVMLWLIAASALADIVQPDGFHARNLFFPAIGQTFIATAGETNVETVSFGWGPKFNESLPDPTITLQLRNGAGLSGEVLASQTVTSIPDSTPYGTWIDFTFPSPVNLIEGETYTLHFTKINTGNVSGSFLASGHSIDPYPIGYSIIVPIDPLSASLGIVFRTEDLVFRVVGAAMPEPGSLVFVAMALMTAVFDCRTRRSMLNGLMAKT